MPKVKSRAWLIFLKIADTWTPLVGLTGKNLSINNERVDATIPDAETPEGEQWRATLQDTKSVDLGGDFTVFGDAAQRALIGLAMAEEPEGEFQTVIPGVGTWEGVFSIAIQFGTDGKVTGSMSLASEGKITFTAASAA